MTKILLLEDDDHFRSVLTGALEDEGYSVVACASGDEAVEKARHHDFTLVVADIKMKGMDGLGAVSLIQSLQPEMSSLVVTGYADNLEQSRADNLCLDGFLEKPFDLEVLLDRVETLVLEQSVAKSERQATRERLDWARWLNDREGQRAKDLAKIDPSELIRITRSLTSRIGLEGFLGEQILSAQLWLASQQSPEPTIPKPLQPFLGSECQGLVHDTALALSSLFRKPQQAAPEYLLSLLEELKVAAPDNTQEQSGLLETARLLLQRGDEEACRSALDNFLASPEAFGRGRIQGQVLRAQLCLRAGRPAKAEQVVQRMMESARQDGPIALSEACRVAGAFLLKQGSYGKARGAFEEAGQAYQALNFERESAICFLLRDLLLAPRLTTSLKEGLKLLLRPDFAKSAASFKPTLELVLKRWSLSLEQALQGDTSLGNRVELYSLGGFQAFLKGKEIPNSWWRSAKARQLFSYLALDGKRLSEESLIEQFWPGDPGKGKNNLYTAASYIRGALRKAGLEQDPLVRSGKGLELSKNIDVWHDCCDVLVARDAQDLEHWRRALTLYKGSFLPDCYLEWAEDVKRAIDEAFLALSLKVGAEALSQSRLGEAVECGRTALSISPCLEQGHTMVMDSLIKQNRYLEVVRHYERCQQTYQLELNDSPPVEVEKLYHQARLSL